MTIMANAARISPGEVERKQYIRIILTGDRLVSALVLMSIV